MSQYINGTKRTWAQIAADLTVTMDKWGVEFENWQIETVAVGAARNRRQGYREANSVTLSYRPPGRQEVVRMVLDTQGTPARNLSSIAITCESIRMQERRGLGGLVEAHYLALAAPVETRDPFEVLGLRPGASPVLIDAAYKALSKEAHPDTGGSEDAMTELNEARAAAIERLG